MLIYEWVAYVSKEMDVSCHPVNNNWLNQEGVIKGRGLECTHYYLDSNCLDTESFYISKSSSRTEELTIPSNFNDRRK